MQSKYFFRIFVIIACLSILGLGLLAVLERNEIDSLRHQVEIVSQVKPAVKPIEENARILTTKNLVWNNQFYQLQHLCKGISNGADSSIIPFNAYEKTVDVQAIGNCIGENQLVLIAPNERKILLQTVDVKDVSDAVSLLGYQLISENGTLLIQFSTPPFCDGVGCIIAPNSVSAVFHLNDLNPSTSFRVLKNYPKEGYGDWNPEGTKAIFYPDTMDRDGAHGSPGPTRAVLIAKVQGALIGYDLNIDIAVQKNPSDKAAYYYVDATDYVLNKENPMIKFDDKTFLPTWMTCVNPGVPCNYAKVSKWINSNQYNALIALPAGGEKKIQIAF